MHHYINVTRVIRSTKMFVIEANDPDEAKVLAEEAACEDPEISEGVDGWTENLSWETENAKYAIIDDIATRALAAGIIGNSGRLTLLMDLKNVNDKVCELDFEALLKAEESEFAHDICGIQRNINRETGKLENCFRPRFARS